MSSVRIKIFSFDSTKYTALQIEDEINKFLERADIIVQLGDVELILDDVTIVKISYKLRKSRNKNIKK